VPVVVATDSLSLRLGARREVMDTIVVLELSPK
jgi:hypothetical protein